MNQRGYLTDEQISDIKSYFLNSNLTIRELARRSQDLFGQKISYNTLNQLSDTDSSGSNWYVQRTAHKSQSPSFLEQVEQVRDVVFRDIINTDTPAAARASLVKAWMELSKNTESGKASSAKTSPERALEIARQALLELADEDNDQPAASQSE